MEKSDARNERVLQILNELGSNDIPQRPVWGAGEHPAKVPIPSFKLQDLFFHIISRIHQILNNSSKCEQVLEVPPGEMISKTYETEAMRETRRKVGTFFPQALVVVPPWLCE